MATHICSPCGKEFKTEKEYLEHKCEKRGGARPDGVKEKEEEKEEAKEEGKEKI